MPDKKLTDNEIVKALEEHYKQVDKGYSTHLEYGGKGDEHEEKYIYMLCDILDLINRLQEEIEKLTSGKCVYLSDDETTEYCVEGPCPNYKTVAQIKAEAYKECIEKAKEEINKHSYDVLHKIVINHKLDNLLKELVGDSDDRH